LRLKFIIAHPFNLYNLEFAIISTAKLQKVYLCSKNKTLYHVRELETIHGNQDPHLPGDSIGQRLDWGGSKRRFHADG
jgi:hypothetical protein